MFEGRRWSVPGDFATVEADGTLKLLGRGSQVINTGGEKVFPEEVEEAIKRYPGVRDAAVVGVPDARFGERICAVVEMAGARRRRRWRDFDHVRTHLAALQGAPRTGDRPDQPRRQRQARLQGGARHGAGEARPPGLRR